MKRYSPLQTSMLAKGAIVSADTFAEIICSDTLMADTRDWAAAQRADLEQHTTDQLAASHAEGLRRGLDRLSQTIDAYSRAERALDGRVKPLVELCLKHILNDIPRADLFEPLIADVLDASHLEKSITIMAHPKDMDALKAAVARWQGDSKSKLDMQIEPHESAEPGNCEIFTSKNVMSTGISLAIDQVLAALESPMPGLGYAEAFVTRDAQQLTDRQTASANI